MKWLINSNKKYKVPYILSNIFLIFFDTIGIVIPILTGYLVDTIIIDHNYNHLFLIAISIILIALFKSIGAYISVYKLDTITNKMLSEVKEKCYQNLNNLDYYFYEHNNRGELMTNFTSDFNRLRQHLAFNIKTIGAILLTFLGSLIYLLRINIGFTLILLTPGLLVGLTSFRFLKKIKPE
ncbi:MAG: ABC transporter transmembrane domain-containing protein, partial [Ruminococcus sp.]|nr:ABC transporter transmembrane domain-containing protein [Ruminococcus sp.]